MKTKQHMDGAELIAWKRRRQKQKHGWTAKHDEEHAFGELLDAAVCYATFTKALRHPMSEDDFWEVPMDWPWECDWWNPDSDQVEMLVNAGALIAAEIDRLLRAQRLAGGVKA